ncbi:MAG: nucleotidyltransferase family protein [Chloroflexi bacterium]|nr:nucleotidyltransferase family protein [Chloroflexota bacterium]MBU1662456.1 nucleotidyltransferase family protein [Chloroflexota bacterium]
MDKDKIIRTISQEHKNLSGRYAVKQLYLFGSVARGESTATSDIDFLVEFNRAVGYFHLFALQDYLESLFDCKVDLGTPDSLKPRIRERVIGECIHVA